MHAFTPSSIAGINMVIEFENKMMLCKKIAPSNPNWWEFEHCKVFGVHKARKGPEITSLT